jgi:putative hydrolase of the HAD superfamily
VTAQASETRPGTPLRAVSFDAAGTLFHPVEPVGALYAMVASRHGVAIDPAELHRRFRDAFGNAPPLAFPGVPSKDLRAREKEWWRTLVARVFAGIPFPDFAAYFDDLFAFFASSAAWRIDPDAVPLLRMLRTRGLAILVVSNFDARVRGIMEALGLSPLVDQITLSSEAGAAKPDPAIFRAALGAVGVGADQVVHVGDTVREDLRGARAAGMRVILVGGAELRLEVPDATIVASLGEVAGQLDDAR